MEINNLLNGNLLNQSNSQIHQIFKSYIFVIMSTSIKNKIIIIDDTKNINNYNISLAIVEITDNIIWFVFRISNNQICIYLNDKDTANISV